ncbi:MAG: glycoside hydrolase family 15 protein [Myxococcales bacterium]|nr:glycoside hydrolase family 15 protein [Myxococcales bacterium]
MDLYSAAKRLNRPFVFTDEQSTRALTIADHGLIGDGFSAALVRADGAIDWLCLPRFDSPSVFAALLDENNGGSTSVSPVDYPFESLQRYDPGTNVLETLFQIEGRGTLRLTDYMPWTDDPRSAMHEVHRRVQCVEGEAVVRVIFDPRFDYGRVSTTFEIDGRSALAKGATGERLLAVLGGVGQWEQRLEGGVEAVFRLRAGERGWIVISWNAAESESILAYRPFDALRKTRSRWRDWAQSLEYDGPWRHHVIRSALLLKLLMYAPTGGMVAAPTTSIPEWIGGVRNWDYRYTWTRDTAMAVRAANLLGCRREAREFFHFVRDTLERDRELHIMYAVDGGRVPDETTLEHFAGYRGSKPVRIGNGARDQLQLDTAGALMDAAYMYERGGGSLTARGWRRLRGVVANVAAMWAEPDHGIWEPRAGKRHNVHSKLMSWLALRRGAELAPLFGEQSLQARWQQVADGLHAELCARGLDKTGKRFVAAYGHEHPDASLLLLPIHGFLPPSDERILRTVEWIQDSLGAGPYLYRYRTDDGVGGEEGAFALCGFWLAEVLAMAGRIDEAQRVFVAHAEASNHLGLLAEQIEPGARTLLGNFPQAFSHLGLINAAARIDLALRLRDEGSARVPEIEIGR